MIDLFFENRLNLLLTPMDENFNSLQTCLRQFVSINTYYTEIRLK